MLGMFFSLKEYMKEYYNSVSVDKNESQTQRLLGTWTVNSAML